MYIALSALIAVVLLAVIFYARWKHRHKMTHDRSYIIQHHLKRPVYGFIILDAERSMSAGVGNGLFIVQDPSKENIIICWNCAREQALSAGTSEQGAHKALALIDTAAISDGYQTGWGSVSSLHLMKNKIWHNLQCENTNCQSTQA